MGSLHHLLLEDIQPAYLLSSFVVISLHHTLQEVSVSSLKRLLLPFPNVQDFSPVNKGYGQTQLRPIVVVSSLISWSSAHIHV